jgi:hypothetical protein
MRERLSLRNLFVSTAVVGFLVTLLESVCTGQVYVPTLVFLAQHPAYRARAGLFLIFYNLMFILPLAFVIVAAYFGARNQRLLEWGKKNVVWSKVLMGCFFFGLALFLVFL